MYKWLRLVFSCLSLLCLFSCCQESADNSLHALDRRELLNRMNKVERIYVWNNFKTAVEHPELISEDVFEGLPSEWRELKKHIRRREFDKAYGIIEKESFGILVSLRYLPARDEFYEMASSFHHYFLTVEEACYRCNEIGRDIWFMMEYPVFGIDIE